MRSSTIPGRAAADVPGHQDDLRRPAQARRIGPISSPGCASSRTRRFRCPRRPACLLMDCPAEFLALAERLADASGEIVRRYFRQPRRRSSPRPIRARSPSPTARRRSCAAPLVRSTYPAHGLIGEEFGAERADAEFVWIFDPIDGTKSFITGRPLFGTLIALLHRGRPILGVIDHPALRRALDRRHRAIRPASRASRSRCAPAPTIAGGAGGKLAPYVRHRGSRRRPSSGCAQGRASPSTAATATPMA